jgi:hypothetical protein
LRLTEDDEEPSPVALRAYAARLQAMDGASRMVEVVNEIAACPRDAQIHRKFEIMR